jgi:hypothetical protein
MDTKIFINKENDTIINLSSISDLPVIKKDYVSTINSFLDSLNLWKETIPEGILITGSIIKYYSLSNGFTLADIDKTINIYIYNGFKKENLNKLNLTKTDYGYNIFLENYNICIHNILYQSPLHIFRNLKKKSNNNYDILLGFNGKDVIFLKSNLDILQNTKPPITDLITGKQYDIFKIKATYPQNIFESIKFYSFPYFEKYIPIQYTYLDPIYNLTVIETLIFYYYYANKILNNNELTDTIINMIYLASQYTYLRPIKWSLQLINIEHHKLKILNNIKSSVKDNNITINKLVKNSINDYSHNLHQIFIHNFIINDDSIGLKKYSSHITESSYVLLEKYNARKCLELFIEENIFPKNSIIEYILYLEHIDLIEKYKLDTFQITDSILNYIISNNKLVSFYYLYKKDNNIINRTLNNGNTLLHEANETDMIKLLIKLDNKLIYKKNKNNIIPLYYHINKPLDILLLFFEHYKLNHTDDLGNNIIHHCIKYNKLDLLNYLLLNTDFSQLLLQQNNNYETPLIMASKKRLEDFVFLLMKNSDTYLIRDNYGNTFYHYVCKNSMCLGISIINTPNNYMLKPSDYSSIDLSFWNFIECKT